MSFELHIQIEDQSQENDVLQFIMNRDMVSPEEAVRRALRHPALAKRTPADDMIGAFSSPDDILVIDEVMRSVSELREKDRLRDFGE